MDRTLYNDGTVVAARQLTRTEDTRVFHILTRFLDGIQTGVAEGLQVTVNPVDTSLVDIAVGNGYAPNGEFIEVVNALNQVELVTAGDNVVGLVYTEVESEPRPHETNGTAPDSRATRAYFISVLSGADYEALPGSSDDLSEAARDRFLAVAIVNNFVSPLDITLPPDLGDRIVTVTQPTLIPGIVVTAIDPTTLKTDPSPNAGVPSEAEITYNTTTGLSTYQAPFDTGPGPSQNISGGGAFTFSSANGQTITIDVESDLLPITGGALTDDTLEVAYLYDRTVQRVGARDEDHRHITGGQAPTLVNPHGLRLSDISTIIERIPGLLELGTALDQSIAGVLTPRLRIPVVDFTGLGNDFTALMDFPGAGQSAGPYTPRIYASEFDSLVITVNARYFQDGTPTNEWQRDTSGFSSLKVEFANDAFVVSQRPASAGNAAWADSEWEIIQFLDAATNQSTIQCGVVIGEGCLDTDDDVETPRISTHYSKVGSRVRTLIWTSRGVTATFPTVFDTGESTYSIYRVSGNDLNFGDPDAFELVRNAVWDDTALTWTRVGGGSNATKLFISNERISMFRRTSGGSWADSAWDTNEATVTFGTGNATFAGDLSASDISGSGNLTVAGTGAFTGALSSQAVGATALNVPNGGGTFLGATATSGPGVSARTFSPAVSAQSTGSGATNDFEAFVMDRLYKNMLIVAKGVFTYNGTIFTRQSDDVNISSISIGTVSGGFSPLTVTFSQNVGAGAIPFITDVSTTLTSSRALVWNVQDHIISNGVSVTIRASDVTPATEGGVDFNALGNGVTGDAFALIMIRAP